MDGNDELSAAAFLNVLVALILFFEINGEKMVPVKTLKSLLEHYNIL
ncbi:hypothetical protein [Lucifera butyrica]|nr:hypothetical protein [Lucifera butyrica]